MTRYRNFTVQLGYAEDALLSTMDFSHHEGFGTVVEAMEHLRLAAISYLASLSGMRPCCEKAMTIPNARFCSECGTALNQLSSPDPDAVQDFFYGLPVMTMDEAGEMLTEFEHEHGWVIGYFLTKDPPCSVVGVNRWMGRESDADRPFMMWTLPDGKEEHTRE
jgi:hypothetical protein